MGDRQRVFRTLAALACAAGSLSVCGGAAADGLYEGHALVRGFIQDEAQLGQFLSLTNDVWSHRIALGPIDARFTPEQLAALTATGIPFAVLDPNLQDSVDREQAALNERAGVFYDNFRTNAQISAEVDALVLAHPALASRISLGSSIELRDIYALKIGAAGVNKPAVLIQATQHAREWIAPMTAMFIADSLLTGYGVDSRITALLNALDVYVVPVVNPDGYEFSWTDQRFWRKNRRLVMGTTYGVDNNRNWAVGWGGPGSSGTPSALDYRGTAPFSEPENQAIRVFVLAHPELRAMFDLHSYGQLILTPLGYTTDLAPDPDWVVFERANAEVEAAVEAVHGVDYLAGAAGADQYVASGDAPDWHYVDENLVSWTIELRPDSGIPGFAPPASEIVPVGEEMFAGALTMMEVALRSVSIDLANTPAAILTNGQVQTIDAEIFPMFKFPSVDASSVVLFSRTVDGGAFSPTPMAAVGGDIYRADLPAAVAGGVMEYYIGASAVGGDIAFFPQNGPNAPLSIEVANPDFDDSGSVDGADLAYLLSVWGTADAAGDLNGDANVDGADLALLLASWGT
jgi:carboxypeptidase A2